MDPKPKVVILCGGRGTRFREETELRPKPLIEIGGKPMLWHIMETYIHHGFKDFVLCLGYKKDLIKNYFTNYNNLNNDFTIDLNNGKIDYHNSHMDRGLKVTLVDTGENAMTGSRVKRIEKYIDGDTFMLTYGDGVADIDLNKLLQFHKAHGKIGTITGVSPPSRFGELEVEKDRVLSFEEKPPDVQSGNRTINGGFFVFNRKFFKYLKADDSCVLEREPLANLAKDGQLMVHHHKGFWQCMDTFRDYELLTKLWATQKPPWKVWGD